MNYSYDTIIDAWADYKAAKAFCILKDGKWKNVPLINGQLVPNFSGATSTKLRDLRDIMEFPEYIEFHWKKDGKIG